MASSASNMASIPFITERFSDGITIAQAAFDNNTTLINGIKNFAMLLAENCHPITTIPLLDAPTFEELTALFNLTAPVAPSTPDFPNLPDFNTPAPTTEFEYTESLYVSPVDSALKTKLVEKIAAGGTGLDASVEEDIWNRELERSLLNHADAIARLEDELAAGGFSLPDGVVTAAILDQETKFNDARLTTSRDIATKQAELAYNQTTKILELSVNEEQVNTNYATSMRNRLLEAAKAGPEIAVSIFKAAVERVNVYIAQYNALAQKANAQAEIFKAQMTGYTGQIDGTARVLEASVNKYSAEVAGVHYANSDEINKDQILINQLVAFLNLQLESMKAIASVNSQIAASALTGISASASIGGSEVQSFSLSDSDIHSYDETKSIPPG